MRIIGNTVKPGKQGGEGPHAKELVITQTIPAHGQGGPEIPQELARRKVHYLVTQITRKGRKKEWITEIKKLHREYSINIPYK